MSGKEPKAIAEILDALKHSNELGQHFEIAQIWRRWPEVAGTKLMDYGRPIGIRDDTLFIEVESPVWMHRYSYHKWEILHRINALLNKFSVNDLFFVLENDEFGKNPQDTV